jgi:hypothetical protein
MAYTTQTGSGGMTNTQSFMTISSGIEVTLSLLPQQFVDIIDKRELLHAPHTVA